MKGAKSSICSHWFEFVQGLDMEYQSDPTFNTSDNLDRHKDAAYGEERQHVPESGQTIYTKKVFLRLYPPLRIQTNYKLFITKKKYQIDFAIDFVLLNMTTGERHYFHASDNTRVLLDEPYRNVRNEQDFGKLTDVMESSSDLKEYAPDQRPDRKCVLLRVTNVLILTSKRNHSTVRRLMGNNACRLYFSGYLSFRSQLSFCSD